MINCPNCGAGNSDNAPYCRLCATPLAAPAKHQSSVSYQQPSYQPDPVPSQLTCPVCHTVNDGSWAFCQECGTKLSPARPKTAPVQSPADQSGQETVVMKDSGTASMKPGNYNPVTTVADPFSTSIDDSSATRIDDFASRTMVDDAMATRVDVNLAATIIGKQSPTAPTNPADLKTVIAEFNPAELTTAPDMKDAPFSSETVFDTNQSFSGVKAGREVVCPQCSHKSAAGSTFCANCGTRLSQPQPAHHHPSMPPQKAPVQEIPQGPPMTMWGGSAAPPIVPPVTTRGRLHLVMEGGQQGEVYDLKDTTMVGRTAGDLSFPHDGYMSGRHAQIVRRGNDFYLVDAGSRNGTFIRIKGEVKLEPDDMILIGKQLFRFEKS